MSRAQLRVAGHYSRRGILELLVIGQTPSSHDSFSDLHLSSFLCHRPLRCSSPGCPQWLTLCLRFSVSLLYLPSLLSSPSPWLVVGWLPLTRCSLPSLCFSLPSPHFSDQLFSTLSPERQGSQRRVMECPEAGQVAAVTNTTASRAALAPTSTYLHGAPGAPRGTAGERAPGGHDGSATRR